MLDWKKAMQICPTNIGIFARVVSGITNFTDLYLGQEIKDFFRCQQM